MLCYRGDLPAPVVEEYEVGPLPLPTSYSPIAHSKWRNPIPYTARPYNSQLDSVMWDKFICRKLSNINHILYDITGHTYSPDCGDHCLTYRYTVTCTTSRSLIALKMQYRLSFSSITLQILYIIFNKNVSYTKPGKAGSCMVSYMKLQDKNASLSVEQYV